MSKSHRRRPIRSIRGRTIIATLPPTITRRYTSHSWFLLVFSAVTFDLGVYIDRRPHQHRGCRHFQQATLFRSIWMEIADTAIIYAFRRRTNISSGGDWWICRCSRAMKWYIGTGCWKFWFWACSCYYEKWDLHQTTNHPNAIQGSLPL